MKNPLNWLWFLSFPLNCLGHLLLWLFMDGCSCKATYVSVLTLLNVSCVPRACIWYIDCTWGLLYFLSFLIYIYINFPECSPCKLKAGTSASRTIWPWCNNWYSPRFCTGICAHSWCWIALLYICSIWAIFFFLGVRGYISF